MLRGTVVGHFGAVTQTTPEGRRQPEDRARRERVDVEHDAAVLSEKSAILVVENQAARTACDQAGPGGKAHRWLW